MTTGESSASRWRSTAHPRTIADLPTGPAPVVDAPSGQKPSVSSASRPSATRGRLEDKVLIDARRGLSGVQVPWSETTTLIAALFDGAGHRRMASPRVRELLVIARRPRADNRPRNDVGEDARDPNGQNPHNCCNVNRSDESTHCCTNDNVNSDNRCAGPGPDTRSAGRHLRPFRQGFRTGRAIRDLQRRRPHRPCRSHHLEVVGRLECRGDWYQRLRRPQPGRRPRLPGAGDSRRFQPRHVWRQAHVPRGRVVLPPTRPSLPTQRLREHLQRKLHRKPLTDQAFCATSRDDSCDIRPEPTPGRPLADVHRPGAQTRTDQSRVRLNWRSAMGSRNVQAPTL